MLRQDQSASRLWLMPSLLVAAIVAIPLLAVLASLLAPATDGWSHILSTVLGGYLTNTISLMVLVGVLSLLPGVGCAWLVAACEFPGRRYFDWLLVVPLAAPAYVVAYAYTDLLDVSGPLQSGVRELLGLSVADFAISGFRSLPGAAIVLSLVLYPYIYLLAKTSFSSRSGAQFEAARVLGLSPYRAFWHVALPSARPAIAGGLALVLMETLADFGVVDYFAVPTFSTGIFRTWIGLGDKTAALKLAAIMLLFVLILITLEGATRKGRPDPQDHRRPRSMRLTGLRAGLACLACLTPVVLGFILPVAVLLGYKLGSGGDQLLGRGFWEFSFNSARVSSVAALLAALLALLMGYANRQKPGRAGALLIRFGTLGYALPGMLLAVGLLGPIGVLDRHLTVWLRDAVGYSGGLVLSGTTALLIYAYLCRFMTVAFNTVDAGLQGIPVALDASARSLGATPGEVVRRIHLPLLRPSLAAAALLVFVDAMRELPATLMLRPFGFETLATRVYRLASDERLAEASSAALTIVLLGLLPVLLVHRLNSSRPS
jgi:iron(III) transport system permease protein